MKPASPRASAVPPFPALPPRARRGRHRGLLAAIGLAASGAVLAAPPTPPGAPSGTVDGDRVTLSWPAARDDEGVSGYNVYRDDRYLTTVHDTRHVAELGPGVTTTFYVTAFDTPSDGSARGFSNRSPIASFARADGTGEPEPDAGTPDTTRPDTVTGLASTAASPARVSLRWDRPADDVGVIGYNVYRDDRYLTTVNGVTRYDDTRLPDVPNVAYSIVAFDAAKNFSRYSAELVVALGGGSDPAPAPEPAPVTPAPDPAPPVTIGEYERTATERRSLAGPSTRDPSRPPGPPSAPAALTALLVADDWVEFTWVPSVDDSAVVAYEIFRDDQLVGTVDDDGEANRIEERRAWRTTSYIDCNYTKDLNCQRVGQPSPGTAHTYTVVAVDDEGNRSAASAPATFRLNVVERSAAPDPASSGYTLAFEDEFEGTSLDRAKWRTLMPWGPDVTVNGEMQYFVDTFSREGAAFGYDPFVLTGETLEITGIPTPPDLSAAANGQAYLSGMITTRDKFAFTYGYAEMRARVAGGSGLLSTFYLLQPGGNQYEIDILEYDGRRPNGATQNYHYRDGFRFADTGFRGVAHASPTMMLETEIDLSAGYHTYSVLWEEERVIWFIDGEEVRRMTGPRVSDAPMNLVAQLVIGSNWIGDPAGQVSFPVRYEIDYMRVWQR